MNRAKAETNVVSFSSFAERAVRKAGAGGLQMKARVALAQGQGEALLEELAGYMDEVLDNRARMVQRIADSEFGQFNRPARNFRLLRGGRKSG